MTYAKPELVLLADARVAIQKNDQTTTKNAMGFESPQVHATESPAYEADE